MGTPLRKPRVIANDIRPPLRLVSSPAAPRVVAFVRLPAAPETQRDFSWAAAIACVFLGLTVFLLGAAAGTVFWFTYDARGEERVPVIPVSVAASVSKPAPMPIVIRGWLPILTWSPPPSMDLPAPQPALSPPPAPDDLTLPVSSLLPPGYETPQIVRENGMELSVRDAAPWEAEEAGDETEAAQAKDLARQGKLPEAIAHLEHAVRLAPGNMAYRFDLAVLYDRAGHVREALMLYRQVIEVAEEDAPQGYTMALSPETLAALRARADYLGETEGE